MGDFFAIMALRSQAHFGCAVFLSGLNICRIDFYQLPILKKSPISGMSQGRFPPSPSAGRPSPRGVVHVDWSGDEGSQGRRGSGDDEGEDGIKLESMRA